MQFSLIVPCYNNLPITQQFLRSLLAWGPLGAEVELIFVDDASTDGTSSWLLDLNSRFVRVVTHNRNMGFASAVNSGVAAAHGKYVVLLNNDLVLQKGWFEPFESVAKNWSDEFGVFGNVQLREDDSTVDHAGIELTAAGRFSHVKRLPELTGLVECPLLTGACMMLIRDAFLEHGGFDTNYLNGVEDLELCLQLLSAGKKNYLLANSLIRHHVSVSRGNTDNELRDLNNLIRLYSRWDDKLIEMHQALFPDLNSRHVISHELNRLQLLAGRKV